MPEKLKKLEFSFTKSEWAGILQILEEYGTPFGEDCEASETMRRCIEHALAQKEDET